MTAKRSKKKAPAKKRAPKNAPLPKTISRDKELALTGMEDLGDGFENTDRDAYAIPFVRILQTNSPQVNEDEDSYIRGAKAGMFFNTVTEALYGKSLLVVPVHYSRSFIEWRPNRGGFVRDHGPDPKIRERIIQSEDDDRFDYLDNGNIIQDTRNHFLLVLNEKGPSDACILALSSTGIKHSRKWMSMMRGLLMPNQKPAPMFSSIYRMHTVLNKNDDGSWYQIGEKQTAVTREDWISQDLLEEVKSFRNIITSGMFTADYSSLDDDIPDDESDASEYYEDEEQQF